MNSTRISDFAKALREYPVHSFFLAALFVCAIVFASFYFPVSDGYDHLTYAQSIRECRCVPLIDKYGVRYLIRPPLDNIIYALFLPKPIFVNVFFYFLSTAMTYFLARTYLSRKLSLLSALFFASFPTVVENSVNYWSYSIVTFFAITSLYALLNKRFFLSGLFLAFAILSNFSAVTIIPVPFLTILFFEKKDKVLKIFKSYIAMLLAVPFYLRQYFTLGNPFFPFMNPLFGLPSATFPKPKGITEYVLTYPATFFGVPGGRLENLREYLIPFLGLPEWTYYLILIVCLAVVTYIIYCFVVATKKFRMWLMYFVLFFTLVFYVLQYFGGQGGLVTKYSLFLLPFFAFALVWKNRKRAYVLFLLFAVFFIISTAGMGVRYRIAYEKRQHYLPGMEWIKNNTSKNAVFLVPGSEFGVSIGHWGIQYETGRTAIRISFYPWETNHLNNAQAYLIEKFPEIRSRGKNYVISSENITCDKYVYKDDYLKICEVPKDVPFRELNSKVIRNS